MANDVITRFSVRTTDSSNDVITHFRLRAGGGRKDVITRFRLVNPSSLFTVSLAPPLDFRVEPFDRIDLTIVTSQAPNTVNIVQTAGPTVVIGGTGLDRYIIAPATLSGTSLTFQVQGTKAGFPNSTFNYTVAVNPHNGIWRKGGIPARLLGKGDIDQSTPTPPAAAVFNDAGSLFDTSTFGS